MPDLRRIVRTLGAKVFSSAGSPYNIGFQDPYPVAHIRVSDTSTPAAAPAVIACCENLEDIADICIDAEGTALYVATWNHRPHTDYGDSGTVPQGLVSAEHQGNRSALTSGADSAAKWTGASKIKKYALPGFALAWEVELPNNLRADWCPSLAVVGERLHVMAFACLIETALPATRQHEVVLSVSDGSVIRSTQLLWEDGDSGIHFSMTQLVYPGAIAFGLNSLGCMTNPPVMTPLGVFPGDISGSTGMVMQEESVFTGLFAGMPTARATRWNWFHDDLTNRHVPGHYMATQLAAFDRATGDRAWTIHGFNGRLPSIADGAEPEIDFYTPIALVQHPARSILLVVRERVQYRMVAAKNYTDPGVKIVTQGTSGFGSTTGPTWSSGQGDSPAGNPVRDPATVDADSSANTGFISTSEPANVPHGIWSFPGLPGDLPTIEGPNLTDPEGWAGNGTGGRWKSAFFADGVQDDWDALEAQLTTFMETAMLSGGASTSYSPVLVSDTLDFIAVDMADGTILAERALNTDTVTSTKFVRSGNPTVELLLPYQVTPFSGAQPDVWTALDLRYMLAGGSGYRMGSQILDKIWIAMISKEEYGSYIDQGGGNQPTHHQVWQTLSIDRTFRRETFSCATATYSGASSGGVGTANNSIQGATTARRLFVGENGLHMVPREFTVTYPSDLRSLFYGRVYTGVEIAATRQAPVGYQHTRCSVKDDLVVFGPRSFRFVQVGDKGYIGDGGGFFNGGCVQQEEWSPDEGVSTFPAGIGPSRKSFEALHGGSVSLSAATQVQREVTTYIDDYVSEGLCSVGSAGAVTNPRTQASEGTDQPFPPSVMGLRVAEDGTMTIAWETTWEPGSNGDWRDDGWKSAPLIVGSDVLIARQTVGTLEFEDSDHDHVRRDLATKNLALTRFALDTGEQVAAESSFAGWQNDVPWWSGTYDGDTWPAATSDPYGRDPANMGEPIPGDVMLWAADQALLSLNKSGQLVVVT